jgi:hypothetical protein
VTVTFSGPSPVLLRFVLAAPGPDRLAAGLLRCDPLTPSLSRPVRRCFHATPPGASHGAASDHQREGVVGRTDTMYESMGAIRYVIMVMLLLLMALMPIKMVLRWLFNLKYFIYLPEFNANL